jgi:hypothetical protein
MSALRAALPDHPICAAQLMIIEIALVAPNQADIACHATLEL